MFCKLRRREKNKQQKKKATTKRSTDKRRCAILMQIIKVHFFVFAPIVREKRALNEEGEKKFRVNCKQFFALCALLMTLKKLFYGDKLLK